MNKDIDFKSMVIDAKEVSEKPDVEEKDVYSNGDGGPGDEKKEKEEKKKKEEDKNKIDFSKIKFDKIELKPEKDDSDNTIDFKEININGVPYGMDDMGAGRQGAVVMKKAEELSKDLIYPEKMEFEEFKQHLNILDNSSLNFNNILNGEIFFTGTYSSGTRLRNVEKDGSLESFLSVLVDENGESIIEEIDYLRKNLDKDLEEAYKADKGYTTSARKRNAPALVVQSKGNRGGYGNDTYDRLRNTYQEKVKTILNKSLLNPKNSVILDRYIDKGAQNLEASYNQLNLGGNPELIYENEKKILDYNIYSFLLDEDKNIKKEDQERALEVAKLIAEKERNGEDASKLREERKKLLQSFMDSYNMGDSKLLYDSNTGKIYRDETPPPEVEIIELTQLELAQRLIEQSTNEKFSRSTLEDRMVDLHYKIAAIGSSLESNNPFMRNENWFAVTTPEGEIDIEATDGKFKDELINSRYKIKRLPESGNSFPIKLYNQYIDELNVLTSAYYLNYDPVSAFEYRDYVFSGDMEKDEGGWTDFYEGSGVGIYKNFGMFARPFNDGELPEYGMTSRDFSDTFITAMRNTLGDNFKIDEERLHAIGERSFAYNVGEGFPGFVKMGMELALAAGIGNAVGVGAVFAELGVIAESTFAGSRVTRHAMKFMSGVLEESVKLGIYNEVVLPGVNAVSGGSKNTSDEKISMWFSALGGINYGYGKFVEYLMKPNKNGGASVLTSMESNIKNFVGGNTVVTLAKSPIQAVTGASLITAGGLVEGGAELAQGEISFEEFKTQYLSLEGFTSTAAMCLMMQGFSPLKGAKNVKEAFVTDTKQAFQKISNSKKLKQYSTSLGLPESIKDTKNVSAAEGVINDAVSEKLQDIGLSNRLLKYFSDLNIDLDLLSKSKNFSKDVVNIVDGQMNKLIESINKLDADQSVKDQLLLDFQQKADALKKATSTNAVNFQKGVGIYEAGYKTKLYLEQKQFLADMKSGGFLKGGAVDVKLNNLVTNMEKGNVTAQDVLTLSSMGSPKMVAEYLKQRNINQNTINQVVNEMPGYMVLLETANKLGYEPNSKERNKYVQSNLDLAKYKSELEVIEAYNKSAIGTPKNTVDIEAKIENLRENIIQQEADAVTRGKVKAKQYVDKVEEQTKAAGGEIRVFKNKQQTVAFLKAQEKNLPKDVYNKQMEILNDPTKRVDAFVITDNNGNKIQIFDMGTIFTPKTIKVDGKTIEYVDVTAGPHEPIHNFVNSTIKRLGIEGNEQKLSMFVDSFKATMSNSELALVEKRVKTMVDYDANPNTLEWFNAYAELLSTGDLKFPEGTKAEVVAENFNKILEEATGKDFDSPSVSTSVEAIKTIIDGYVKDLVNNPESQPETSRSPVVDKFLEVSYKEDGHYTGIQNKADITNYDNKAKKLREQVANREKLIKTLEAEDPIFNADEIQALKKANERDIDKANTVTSNTEKAKINMENIKILIDPESSLRQIRNAEQAILDNNIGLRQQLKNRFNPNLVTSKEVGRARENWDSQVDFYFSQLLNKHLDTYKRAQAQGVEYGELFYDVEAKGGPKTYVLAEFGAYATFLKEKFGDVIKNYGEESDKFKVYFENDANEGGNPGINPEKIATGGEQNVITDIKPDSKERVVNYDFYPESTKAADNIVQIATIDFKNPKDFYTQAKNLIRDNSGETYNSLIGKQKVETEIAKLKKPTKAEKDQISGEVLIDNLTDLYPKFVEIIEAEGEFMRLRKGIFSNFYESTGKRIQVKKGKEDYVYLPKFTSQAEFVELFTGKDQRTNKRNLENLAWMLDLSNTKKAINEVIENDGVVVVDNKGVNIFNPFSNVEATGLLVKEFNLEAYQVAAEKVDPGVIQNKATKVTPELIDLVDNTFVEMEKNGVKKFDYNKALAIASSDVGSKEYEMELNEEIVTSDGKTRTVGDVLEMFDVGVTDIIKSDGGEVISIVETTSKRINDGSVNEELYDEKNITKEEFVAINQRSNNRGKIGEENQKAYSIVTPKITKNVEKTVNGEVVKEKVLVKDATINKANYDKNLKILGDFVKKLPTKEQLNGTGVSLDALIGDHMRTTGMGTTLLDPSTGKTVSVGKIIETLEQKGIKPGQEPSYYENVTFTDIVSEGAQQKTAKKLLSKTYTETEKDDMYNETYTESDSKARETLLEGLLLAKFDFVWEGKNSKEVLERYDALVKISKSESNVKKGQRVLASIIGAMYKDLSPEEVWVKLEHSTASVDFNSKMLDLIARGDKKGLIELAKTFEGVYGQRANKEGAVNVDNTNFDALDTKLGTTNPNEFKLMATLPAADIPGSTPRSLSQEIKVRKEDGSLVLMSDFVNEVVKETVDDVSKTYPISKTLTTAIENKAKSNQYVVGYKSDATTTKNIVKKAVELEAANKANVENNERIVKNNQSETVGISELQELSKDNVSSNALENANFIDQILDSGGEQPVNITYESTGNTYSYNPTTGVATQPNTKGSFSPKRKVILMAGSAGSGKSGIIKQYYKFLKDNNIDVSDFEYLNVDVTKERLVEEFAIEKNQNKQDVAERSLDSRFMSLSRKEQKLIIEEKMLNGDGFVLDGTLASYRNTNKLIKELEDNGYQVTIVKANATLENKLDRNSKRKERVLRDKIVTKNHEQVEDAFIKYKADGRSIVEVNTNELKMNELPIEVSNDIFQKTNSTIITKVDAVDFTTEAGSIQNKAEVNKVTVSANDLISERFKIDNNKTFEEAEANKLAAEKRKKIRLVGFKARHAMPLLLEIIGKNDRTGLDHMEYGLDLFDQGKFNYASFKRNSFESYKSLNKLTKENGVKLNLKGKMSENSVFSREDAVRIFLWNKNKIDGEKIEIPGLGDQSLKEAVDLVANDPDLLSYANNVEAVFKYGTNNYYKPELGWSSVGLKYELMRHVNSQQKTFMQPFKDYMDATFTKENLNKIKVGMGEKEFNAWWFATSDFIDRGYTGRTRAKGEPIGQKFINWWHGSTALALGGNVKSMFTQLISSSIYLNAKDNNFTDAAKAYADPQIFKAMSYILKSDYLKDRRGSYDLALKELKDAENKYSSGLYDKALNASFLLSQIGDNAAIVMGGSSMLLNKAKKYMKEGMGEDAAWEKAMFETVQFTESTQQSTWARNLSYEQTTGIGKVVLNFLNTNILYNNGALAEVMKIQKNLGDAKSVNTIVNRLGVQTAMFSFLSSGMAYNLLDDEIDPESKEEKFSADKEYAIWGGMVNIINGTGISGKATTTMIGVLKSQYEYMTDDGKREADIAMKMLEFSPSLSIKIKKLKSMEYDLRQAQKLYEKTGKIPSKQLYRAATKLFSFGTNIVWPEYVTTIEDKCNFIMDERYTTMEKYEAAISSVYAGNKDYYKNRNKDEMNEATGEGVKNSTPNVLGGGKQNQKKKNDSYKPTKRKPLGAK